MGKHCLVLKACLSVMDGLLRQGDCCLRWMSSAVEVLETSESQVAPRSQYVTSVSEAPLRCLD